MARTILLTDASGHVGSRLLRVVEECGCRTLAFRGRHRTARTSIRRGHRGLVRRRLPTIALAAAMLQPAHTGAQAPVVRTVAYVDFDRYAGDWFEIARFPNRFQRQCIGDVRASYARRADGRIDVVNRCRTAGGQTEARGVARLVDDQTHARLKVRFAPARDNGFAIEHLVPTTQEAARR